MTTVTGQQLVDLAMTQKGKAYIFGAEVAAGWAAFTNARAWDCLAAETLVHTTRGPVRIDEIEVGDAVWSWDDSNLRPHKVERVEERPANHVFRLRTRNRAIRATANHPFLVLRRGPKHHVPVKWTTEWVKLEDIERGDVVVTLDHHPQPDEQQMLSNGVEVTDEVAWLLGVFTGDGNLRRNGFDICVFGEQREQVSSVLHSVVGQPGQPTDKNGLIVNSAEWSRALVDAGFPSGTTAATKQVPSLVSKLGVSGQRAFLAGYAFADGHFDKRGHQAYSSCNRALVAEARALHIGLGDRVSNITELKRTKPIFIKGVEVQNAQSLWSFVWYPDTKRTGTELLDTYGARRALPDRSFSAEKVLAVDPDGFETTWDIEVEGSHNFAADGLIVHNCSELTERATALLGIYLPDGSQNQRRYCTKHITVAKAKTIPGALLFNDHHVATSRGDGTTIEAANHREGVVVKSVGSSRFTDAALIPGVQYFPVSFQPAPPPPAGSLAELRQALFFAKQFTLGAPDGPGVHNEHSEGGREATLFAQAGLNDWYNRFAKLTGSPDPADHTPDGVWEGWTHDATILMQTINPALAEYGCFGRKSWAATYPS